MCRIFVPLMMLVSGLWAPPPATAQQRDRPSPAPADTLGHATLRAWEEELWLTLLDREDSFDGRFSDHGILKRFPPSIDSKYLLDLHSSRFPPMESHDWYRRTNGFRWRGTSITTLELASLAKFKAAVPLGESWRADIHLDQASNPSFDGSTVRIDFSRVLGRARRVFAGLHLDPHKRGGDVWVGTDWSTATTQVTAQVVVLDFLNNLLYGPLDAAGQTIADSVVVYERQPVALRTAADLRLSESVRLEVFGSVFFPSRVMTHAEEDEALGFALEESVWYAGALLEWAPTPRLLVSGSATNVSAHSERRPNSPAALVQGYELSERTTEIEVFFAFRPSERWTIGGTGVRKWLPEKRTVQDDPTSDVDSLLGAWLTGLDVGYSAPSGFTGGLALFRSDTSVPRGEGQATVWGELPDEFYRVQVNAGWTFENAEIVSGVAYDYHPDLPKGAIWGTASSRITLFW